MPNRPRFTLPGVPLHLIQRDNNRSARLFTDEDYGVYLGWLKKYARDSDCAIHAYVLMTNHVHLRIPPCSATVSTHSLDPKTHPSWVSLGSGQSSD